MDTEAQNNSLPSSVLKRQMWRPMAARAAESLLSNIARRHESFVGRAAQLTAWHGQLTHRVQPWRGWSPLSLEWSAEELPSEEIKQKRPRNESMSQWVNESMGSSDIGHWTLDIGQQSPRVEAVPSRPAMNLAILRTVPAADVNSTRHADSPTPSQREIAQPIADAPTIQTRLMLSVSTAPRQDVRGGFPVTQPPVSVSSDTERTRMEPATLLPRVARRDEGVEENVPRRSSETVEVVAANPAGAVAQTVVERWIEQTVLPAPLPGLELRLLRTEQQASTDNRSSQSSDNEQPATSVPTPPPAATAPPLDINAIADKVYQTLQRRQQVERERRGLY